MPTWYGNFEGDAAYLSILELIGIALPAPLTPLGKDAINIDFGFELKRVRFAALLCGSVSLCFFVIPVIFMP